MPEQEESNEPQGSRSRLGLVAALAVGLPLLYLLSTGPVLSIMDKTNGFGGKVSWSTVLAFYRPVGWLYDHTSMRRPIELYMQLWGLK